MSYGFYSADENWTELIVCLCSLAYFSFIIQIAVVVSSDTPPPEPRTVYTRRDCMYRFSMSSGLLRLQMDSLNVSSAKRRLSEWTNVWPNAQNKLNRSSVSKAHTMHRIVEEIVRQSIYMYLLIWRDIHSKLNLAYSLNTVTDRRTCV